MKIVAPWLGHSIIQCSKRQRYLSYFRVKFPIGIIIFSTHPSRHSSISLKCLKKALNKLKPCVKSAVPITSRQECIESCGIPKSTVRIPVRALIIGPIVVPQGQSDLTTNSCIGILSTAFFAISLAMKPVTPLVASSMNNNRGHNVNDNHTT